MIAVIIGLIPADTATGIAITGMIASDGIAPGPTAQIRNPRMYITNGISAFFFPTIPTILWASSSSVPLLLMIANKYVIPTI